MLLFLFALWLSHSHPKSYFWICDYDLFMCGVINLKTVWIFFSLK